MTDLLHDCSQKLSLLHHSRLLTPVRSLNCPASCFLPSIALFVGYLITHWMHQLRLSLRMLAIYGRCHLGWVASGFWLVLIGCCELAHVQISSRTSLLSMWEVPRSWHHHPRCYLAYAQNAPRPLQNLKVCWQRPKSFCCPLGIFVLPRSSLSSNCTASMEINPSVKFFKWIAWYFTLRGSV